MSNIQRGLMFSELSFCTPRTSTPQLSEVQYQVYLRGLQFG
jgi:hypothetical protein